MSTGEAGIARAGDATFMGHPRGLFYLSRVTLPNVTSVFT